VTSRTTRYETFDPRSVAHYSKSACERMETPWIYDGLCEDISGNDSDTDFDAENPDSALSNMVYIDDDEDYEDAVW
jgi:hypothetical protein